MGLFRANGHSISALTGGVRFLTQIMLKRPTRVGVSLALPRLFFNYF